VGPRVAQRSRQFGSGEHPGGSPSRCSDRQLADRLTSPLARCAGPGVDPDAWYPVSTDPERARAQAGMALALCGQCIVRLECLEMSMRHWTTVGRHGIWGGMLDSERAVLHAARITGTPVTALPTADNAG